MFRIDRKDTDERRQWLYSWSLHGSWYAFGIDKTNIKSNDQFNFIFCRKDTTNHHFGPYFADTEHQNGSENSLNRLSSECDSQLDR